MQPLFLCAHAKLKRRLLVAALQNHHAIAHRFGAVFQHHFRQQRHAAAQRHHRHHRLVAADRGVNRRIADFLTTEPQLDTAAHRPLIGHDKRYRRPVRFFHRHLITHRAGQRRGNQYYRQILQHRECHRAWQGFGFSGDGEIRFARHHFFHCVGGVAGGELNFNRRMRRAESVENGRQMAIGGGHGAENMQFAGK